MKKHILLIENYSYDLLTLRMDYVKFLINKGYKVSVLVPDDGYVEDIKKEGISVYTYPLDRKSLNPIKVFKSIYSIKKIINSLQPDIIHSYRIQPNFIVALVGRYKKSIKIVNHITGLGYAFASNTFKSYIYKKISLLIYSFLSKKSDVLVFQNDDDMNLLKENGINNDKFVLIMGSGVDENLFDVQKISVEEKNKLRKELNISENTIVIITVARLIWEKGIKEFVEAAEKLSTKYQNLLFLSVGWIDESNPSAIPKSFIEKYSKLPNIKFLGKRYDIKELLAISDIYVLQSYYREGIPRSSLEAMAMSLPIITTEMPGCKLTVDNEYNGYKIPPKDTNALINKLKMLINNPIKRQKMGENSREKFIKNFANKVVYKKMEELYK